MHNEKAVLARRSRSPEKNRTNLPKTMSRFYKKILARVFINRVKKAGRAGKNAYTLVARLHNQMCACVYIHVRAGRESRDRNFRGPPVISVPPRNFS